MSGDFTHELKRNLEGFASGRSAARAVSDAAPAYAIDHGVEVLTSLFALEATE